jgi:aryl-alcohol dehydrogenase-like predicted oxidoreductase
MQKRALAGTDLSLSVVGFGSWAIGGEYWGDIDDQESLDAIHAALDAGINWFDTAPIYGAGHSDAVLAKALAGRRSDVIIATKVGPRTNPDTGHAISDLQPANLFADCESSLKRLGTDYIDLLQVHWPCELGTPIGETIQALTRLKSEGKIRYFGLCNYSADDLNAARSAGEISSLQTPYSMIRREFERELLPEVRRKKAAPELGVLVYETLCRGLLTGKYGPSPPEFDGDDLRARDDRFCEPGYGRIHQLNRVLAVLATKLDIPQAALPVGWALTRPGVTGAIVGAKTRAQVEQTARAAELLGRRKLWTIVESYASQIRP